MCEWFSVGCAGVMLLSVIAWILNVVHKGQLRALILPDGSPSIDEFVTRSMLMMARTCATLCQRIYDRAENVPTHLQVDGWKFDELITSPGLSAVCGVVYRDDGPAPSAIVVWRGTNLSNRVQVRANRGVDLVSCKLTIPGKLASPFTTKATLPGLVHQGVAEQFESIQWRVMLVILRHLRAGRKVYVTGHSQGGALAALTVAMMRACAIEHKNSDVCAAGLITFGSMRPGDAEFCKFAAGSIQYDPASGEFGVQRYRNNNDIVPLVPLLSQGYAHCGEELYVWPCSVVTRCPSWPLKLIQHAKPYTEGIIGDGLADHSINEYARHLQAIRIPEA